MPSPLVRRRIGDRDVAVWVTSRTDESVHPGRVDACELATRQRAATGATWVMVDQVHGVDVFEAGAAPDTGARRPIADIVMTQRRDLPIAVWAADCAPLVLAGDTTTLVAVHGGWRGLAAGVLDRAVGVFAQRGEDVAMAVLGPVIHPCCYEFGVVELRDVAAGIGVEAHLATARTRDGRTALDVPAAVRAGLARHGIELEHLGACTGCDDRWYSHRARGDLGRHAVVIEQREVSAA